MSTIIHHVTLPVTGMTCAGCASRLTRDLGKTPGIEDVAVNLALEEASLDFDPTTTDLAAIGQSIRDIGFGVRERQSVLDITGLRCAGCATGLEKKLKTQDGILKAEVNYATEQAHIHSVDGQHNTASLIRLVQDAGYEARQPETTPTVTPSPINRDLIELVAAAFLTMPLMAQMVSMMGGESLGWHWHLPPHIECLLTAPILFYIGRRFFRGAWMALKNKSANMDVLVSLGAGAAFAWSCWLWFDKGDAAAGQLYFEAAAVIVTLVLFGKYLENRAKKSATESLNALMALRPDTATILRAGTEHVTPIGDVLVGDIVIVKPGERLPVDGIITRGDSELDESLVTGESLPVARHKGDAVLAGSMNGYGPLRIRTESIGKDTSLAKIADLVAKAQTGKAPIQRLVDKISAVFVPIVVLIALATFFGWWLIAGDAEQGLIAAIAVLVIACPCALGLATPTALVAGTGMGARHGILIRDIDSLERAAHIDHVIFDKTGTLTEGHPSLVAHSSSRGSSQGNYQGDRDDALILAAALQQGSEHPLAKAFLDATKEHSLPEIHDIQAITGAGIEGTWEGNAIRLGKQGFVTETAIPADLQQRADDHPDAIQVWLSVNGNVTGFFALEDPLRKSAADTIRRLQNQQVGQSLLTGDREAVANAIGAQAGIRHVVANCRPEDKATAIEALQQQGHIVAMTGDGINDAPALAQADLGIAMASGSDIAMQTAGITLMRPDPILVPAALDIARKTRAVIRQNLFWAFIYNVIGLPIAAFGLLNPAFAGAAMALSSVSVVSNSLRLKRWSLPVQETK